MPFQYAPLDAGDKSYIWPRVTNRCPFDILAQDVIRTHDDSFASTPERSLSRSCLIVLRALSPGWPDNIDALAKSARLTTVTVCFCTLAIHAPYRRRAHLLCAGAPQVPWIVLTDEPQDFADLPVRAIRHAPTGPMAVDYLAHLPKTGEGRGAAAYHDKRFALLAALDEFDTAIYVDADSCILKLLSPPSVLPTCVAVLPVVRKSIAEHLATCGTWRLPVFEELAQQLTGGVEILRRARWCHETLIGLTRGDSTTDFFDAWSMGADFLQSRSVYSGEGGVIGIAAAHAGLIVDYDTLTLLANSIQHEGRGPKKE